MCTLYPSLNTWLLLKIRIAAAPAAECIRSCAIRTDVAVHGPTACDPLQQMTQDTAVKVYAPAPSPRVFSLLDMHQYALLILQDERNGTLVDACRPR